MSLAYVLRERALHVGFVSGERMAADRASLQRDAIGDEMRAELCYAPKFKRSVALTRSESQSRIARISPTRAIQQLVYDGKRLFCPDHPNQDLATSQIYTKQQPAKVGYFCPAVVGKTDNGTLIHCMNSAEWRTKDEMDADLHQESEQDSN